MKSKMDRLGEMVKEEVNARTTDPKTALIASVLAWIPGERLPGDAQDFDGVVRLAEQRPEEALDLISKDISIREKKIFL